MAVALLVDRLDEFPEELTVESARLPKAHDVDGDVVLAQRPAELERLLGPPDLQRAAHKRNNPASVPESVSGLTSDATVADARRDGRAVAAY